MKVYRLKNTRNGYPLGIFTSKEKAEMAMEKLKDRIRIFDMIIIEENLDEIFEDNVEAK